jgi:uncharacterized repeat protein (TIGR01451 family)
MLAALMGALALPVLASAAPAVELQQCKNGMIVTPVQCLDSAPPTGWQGGNASPPNAQYREGESIPYRAIITETPAGEQSIDIGFDFTKGDAHALDYMTSYNRTETNADACDGVLLAADCVEGDPVEAPRDPTLPLADPPVDQIEGLDADIRIWNGDLIEAYYIDPDTGERVPPATLEGPEGDTITRHVRIVFEAATAGETVVIAWGGHIASELDWIENGGASAIEGSPYHTYMVDSSFNNPGAQDAQLSASAIAPRPAMTTVVQKLDGTPISTATTVGTIYLGESVKDVASFTQVGNYPVAGTVNFFVCQTTAPAECLTGGTAAGSVAFTTNTATSPNYQPPAVGTYCFRGEYVPATLSPYSATEHTNRNTECVNVVQRPTVTVRKVVNGSNIVNGQGDFPVTLTGTGLGTTYTNILLGHNEYLATPAPTLTATPIDLTAGQEYTLSEGTLPAGYTFDSITCTVGNPAAPIGGTVQGDPKTYKFTPAAAQSVTCVVSNDEAPKLELRKSLSPTTDPGRFDLVAQRGSNPVIEELRANNQGNGGTTGANGLIVAQATYTILEEGGDSPATSLADYGSTVACYNRADLDQNGQPTGGAVRQDTTPTTPTSTTLVVAEGDDLVCTFVNTRETGKLEVVKALNPSTDPGLFNLFAKQGATTILTASNVGDTGTTGLNGTTVNTGSYVISETAGTNTTLDDYTSDIACYTRADYLNGGTNTNIATGTTVAITENADVVCVVTNTRNTGKLEVVKHLNPSADPGLFNLFAKQGATTILSAANVGDNGTTGAGGISVNTGTYAISETAGTGTNLDNYTSTTACFTRADFANGVPNTNIATGANVNIAKDADVVCVVTNTRRTTTVTVTKQVIGGNNDATPFDMTFTGEDPFALADGQSAGPFTVNVGDAQTLTELPITTDGYEFVGIECIAGPQEPIGDADGQSITFTPVTEATINCVVTNTRLAKLIVNKVVNGTTAAGVDFGFTLDGTLVRNGQLLQPAVLDAQFTLANGESDEFILDPGAGYTLNETSIPDGYAFESVACSLEQNLEPDAIQLDPKNPLVDLGELNPGDVVRCTYTNTKLPTLQVSKVLTGDSVAGDTSPFAFTVNGTAFATLTGGQSSSVTVVPLGNHTVAEGTLPTIAGFTYAYGGVSCTNNGAATGTADNAAQSVALNLGAGDNVVCVFTNTKTAIPPPPVVITETPLPVIGLTKAAPARARGLQRFVYTLRVRNRGTVVARNVVITDPLPRGLIFIRSSRKATVAGGTVTIKMGTLQPGQSRVVKLTVRGPANISGRRVNLATARATDARPVRARAVTVFRPLVRRIVPIVTG